MEVRVQVTTGPKAKTEKACLLPKEECGHTGLFCSRDNGEPNSSSDHDGISSEAFEDPKLDASEIKLGVFVFFS